MKKNLTPEEQQKRADRKVILILVLCYGAIFLLLLSYAGMVFDLYQEWKAAGIRDSFFSYWYTETYNSLGSRMRGKFLMLPGILALGLAKTVFRLLRWVLRRIRRSLDGLKEGNPIGMLWRGARKLGVLGCGLILAGGIALWMGIGDGAGAAAAYPITGKTLDCSYSSVLAIRDNGQTRLALSRATIWDMDDKLQAARWKDVQAVAVNDKNYFVLKSDGTVDYAGDLTYDLSGWEDICAIAAADVYLLGLRSDGTVIAAVAEDMEELDQLGFNAQVVQVQQWRNIVAISAGSSHSLGLCADGTVVAAGFNPEEARTHPFQQTIAGWQNVTAIHAGLGFAAALTPEGKVLVANSSGQDEYGTAAWTKIQAIASGYDHILGLRDDGTVVAAGENDEGQCNVTGWKNIVAIAAAKDYSLGICADGTLVAAGELPDGLKPEKWDGLTAGRS